MAGCAPVPIASDARLPEITVFYAGADSGSYGVQTAIDLMQASGLAAIVDDPALADVFVINGEVPDPQETAISGYVQSGAGMVLIPGPDMTGAQMAALLSQDVTVGQAEDALSLISDKQSTSPILKDIVWGSAPQVRERAILAGLNSQPIIQGYQASEAILSETTVEAGHVFIFTPYIDGVNTQFQEWPYFNYFIYNLIARAAKQTPLTFGDYPASPVPHTREKTILVSLCVVVTLVAFSIFIIVRRYSLKHPEILDELVASKENYNIREAGTAWEEVGFHRPLAGFMFAMMMGILLFIPLIIYQNMILPTFILPSAQAFGLIGRVGQIFTLAWTLFDVGTSIAFVKFYSQYRVHDPRRAIQFGQVFVWWQALSGAFQVALVVILAGTFVPKTSYAIYTWIIVVHAVIQVPGFYRVMRDAMYAQQRLDYAQILDNFIMLVWPMVTQPIFVLLMLWWSRQSPMVGGALGGAIGLAVAAYAVELCNFLLGLWLYRRIGFNSRILFLAHFDVSVIKQAFRFGALDMSGSVILAAASAIEIFITQTRLINYAEVWGNWMLANNFMLAFDVLRNLVDGVMPAISEAISHARRKLSQYYVSMSYKWDAMIGGFVAAVLLAIADRFIIGSSGPEFSRAAIYVLPLIAFGSVQHLNMIGDAIALASNKPGHENGDDRCRTGTAPESRLPAAGTFPGDGVNHRLSGRDPHARHRHLLHQQ